MEFRHGWIQGFCYIIGIVSLSFLVSVILYKGFHFSQIWLPGTYIFQAQQLQQKELTK